MTFQKELNGCLSAGGERPAIEQGSMVISYAGLRQAAARVQVFLEKSGLPDGTVVGISMSNRIDMISAIIGVINARCVFVLIDGNWPPARLVHIFRDLGLEDVICCREDHKAKVTELSGILRVHHWEDILDTTAEANAQGREDYDGEDNLYIYFTSGSTGRPKGIVGKNASLLHFLRWEIATFGIDETYRVSQFISPYFDAFLRDIFVPLMAGGTVCIPSGEEHLRDADSMAAWIDGAGIGLIHCVPTLFRMLNEARLDAGYFERLRYVLLSGEKVVPAELERWYKVFGDRIRLVNLYGPTETTMIRTFYLLGPADAQQVRIPVGKPISDTEIAILDKSGKPVQVIVPGELCIHTPYGTQGYLNMPELNAEKYVRLRAATGGEKRFFRTGDIARKLPNGLLDLIGREDRQIKLRGIRIEPDEIEAALVRTGAVKNAIVIRHSDEKENETLVAFALVRNPAEWPQKQEAMLLNRLAGELPAYMLPSRILLTDSYPLLSNGKVDHGRLLQLLDRHEMVEPANETEERLLAIWKEILGERPISTTDNFTAAGGNSLTMMRLLSRIYTEFNVRVTLSELFSALSIQKQSGLIRQARQEMTLRLLPADKRPAYNLSSGQQGLYYRYELDRESLLFNLPMVWRIIGPVDKTRIGRALKALIARHQTLRTAFRFQDDRVWQVVEETPEPEVTEIEAASVNEAIRAFKRPFDLSKAPLLRCAILRTQEGEMLLLADMHHIICDGMSQVILFDDFLQYYKGGSPGPMLFQYTDYSEWEFSFRNTTEYMTHREFWLREFESGVPLLDLPVSKTAGKEPVSAGSNLFFTLEREQIAPLLQAIQLEKISAYSALMTIYFVFLSHITGKDDIIVGINTTGRLQGGLERVAGMFTRTLPVRFRIDERKSFSELAGALHGYLLEVYDHQLYDLPDIIRELNKRRTVPAKGLFETMFVFQQFDVNVRTEDGPFEIYPYADTSSKYPISLFVTEHDGAYHFRIEYQYTYFSHRDIEALIAYFRSLITRLAEDTDAVLSSYTAEANQPAEVNITFNF